MDRFIEGFFRIYGLILSPIGKLIPQRYMLGVMGSLAIVNAYHMRICLSVAVTVMANSSTKSNATISEDQCSAIATSSNKTSSNELLSDTYDWDARIQGIILGSFYWGYLISHVPGGIIAEKFGGKHTLGIGMLASTIFTILTPLLILIGNWHALIVVRIIEGLGQGVIYPALTALLAQWAPQRERALIGTLVFAGAQLGTVIGTAISGVFIDWTRHWESVFYLFGFMSAAWCLFWTLLCFSTPSQHPFISDKELEYLKREIEAKTSTKGMKTPWKGIFTSVPFWALLAAQVGHDWGLFMMVTDLPVYMSEIQKFKIKENGFLSALPYVLMWMVSLPSGYFCDWLIARNYLSITNARKVFTTVSSAGPSVFIVGASYAGCDRTLVVVLFVIGMGFMGTFYCGMKVNALDLSPNFAGTIMALTNGIGSLTGIFSPMLIGFMTQNHKLSEWRNIFWIAFVIFSVTNIIFVIWGSGEVQPWNDSETEETH